MATANLSKTNGIVTYTDGSVVVSEYREKYKPSIDDNNNITLIVSTDVNSQFSTLLPMTSLSFEGVFCVNRADADIKIHNMFFTEEGGGPGGAGWDLLGNAGTDSFVNFLGTTDTQKLTIKTDGSTRFQISDVHAGINTFSDTVGSAPGGGFYINSGNITNPEDVIYPGANIGISGGHTGKRSLSKIEGGYWNIGIGDGVLENIANSISNTAIGEDSQNANTNSSGRNTSIGAFSMQNSLDSVANVAIGDDAMRYKSGHDNVAIGSYAVRGDGNVTSNNVIGIGSYACASVGDDNIGIGAYAMTNANSDAVKNISIGNSVGGPYVGINGSASYNTAVGDNVGGEGIVGNHNTLYGEWAGNTLTGGRIFGDYNIAVGSHSGVFDTLNYSIAIGNYVNLVYLNGDGQLNLGNVLYGKNLYQSPDTYSSTPTVNGSIGIGVDSPTARLHLPAGTTTAGTAPLKIPTGDLLDVIEDGAIERDADHIYFSNSVARFQLDQQTLQNSTDAGNLTTNELITTNALTVKNGSDTIATMYADGDQGGFDLKKVSTGQRFTASVAGFAYTDGVNGDLIISANLTLGATLYWPNGSGIICAVGTGSNYANDAAAAAGNIQIGDCYHTSGIVKVRLS